MIRNTNLNWLMFGAALLVSGCATAPKQAVVQTQPVYIAVPTSCVPSTLGPAPTYPDSDAALTSATDAAARELLLYAGRKLRAPRTALLEGVVAGCR